jgi:hypothetical protein
VPTAIRSLATKTFAVDKIEVAGEAQPLNWAECALGSPDEVQALLGGQLGSLGWRVVIEALEDLRTSGPS